MSLESLTKRELIRTANEDFAVEVDQNSTKKEIIEDLKHHGVDYDMYLAANPEAAEKEAKKKAKEAEDRVIRKPEAQEEELYSSPKKEPEVLQASVKEDKVLIKMVRKNPLFEVKRYRFTAQHPFQLVDVKDVDYLCLELDGFRQATPNEVEEYYN